MPRTAFCLIFPVFTEQIHRDALSKQRCFPPDVDESAAVRFAKTYLAKAEYAGPTALSCDDTKLHASLRLYWDAVQETHLLVGGSDGPVSVANPDDLRSILETMHENQATKVCAMLKSHGEALS